MANENRQRFAVTAGVVTLAGFLLATVVWWTLFRTQDTGPTPDELAEIALHASEPNDRHRAAVQLADFGEEAKEALRRVFRETTDVAVLATCIEGLGKLWDYDSMDLLINTVARGPMKVRVRAAVVVSRMTGRDRRFHSNDTEERRQRLVRYMREDWEEIRNSPYFEDLKQRLRESHESS